jgi:competence protein ComEC
MSLRLTALSSSAIKEYRGQSVEIILQVATDPVRVRPKVFGDNFAPKSFSFLGQALLINQKERMRIPVRVIAATESVQGLLPGQKIAVQAKVLSSKEKRVAALLIVKQPIEVVTQPSRWALSLATIRQGLRDATGGGDAGALIPGMVIGDTSKQSEEFKNEMRRSGLTHLVAVSGANFAIVSAFVLWGMQFIFRRTNYRIIATAIALAAFIALVRPSPSVLRAAAMAAVLLAAHASRRGRDALPALGFAIAAVVVLDPFQAREPGFALSVLATAGLLLLAPRIKPTILAAPIAAMVFCSPIIIALSGYISPMSVLANVLAAPAVTPITIVGFIAALFSPLSPTFSTLLITLIKPFAIWITAIADWVARFPVLTLRTGIYGFISALLVTVLLAWGKRKAAALMLAIVFSVTWLQRFPAGDWQIANCDIGQGDALVLNLHHHRAIVIDVGPDPELIDRCLHQLGIKEIPLLILTHPHADHVGGLRGAQKRRKIGQTWYGNVYAGTSVNIGEFHIKVHWPDGDGYSPNNSSIATTIRHKDFTLFAAGDLEPLAQERLVGKIGEVDIYKVSHHGSRFQDYQLLSELSPELAIISVGAENTFGHPSSQVLTALARAGARVVRTDIDGEIAVHASNHNLSLQRAKRWTRILSWY